MGLTVNPIFRSSAVHHAWSINQLETAEEEELLEKKKALQLSTNDRGTQTSPRGEAETDIG
jgi:hypothetical protein